MQFYSVFGGAVGTISRKRGASQRGNWKYDYIYAAGFHRLLTDDFISASFCEGVFIISYLALRAIRGARGAWCAMGHLVAVVSGTGYGIHRKFHGLICWTLKLLGHFSDPEQATYI